LQVAQQKDFPLIDHENILPQNNEGLLWLLQVNCRD
jgi:hypothetical protein